MQRTSTRFNDSSVKLLLVHRLIHYVGDILKGFLSIVLLCVFLGNLFPVSTAFCTEQPSSESSSVSIDISALMPFLATLPPDENDEQVRDWALYGLMNSLALTAQEDVPLRQPSLKDTHPGEVSLGRVFPLSEKEWGVLVSRDILKNKPVLGGLIDRKYARTNSLPGKVSFFSYSRSLSDPTIHIAFEGSVDTGEIFTPAYGYFESTIDNESDFTSFIRKIDDVVMVQWRQKTLLVGGRKYQHDSGRSLTFEDIAALYRAYALLENGLTQDKYESFVQKEFDERVRFSNYLRQELQSGRINKPEIFAEIRSKTPFAFWKNRNQYVGFSLEPDTDYTSLANDLEQFAQNLFGRLPDEQTSNSDSWVSLRNDFIAAAERLRTHRDMKPFLALRWRFKESGSVGGMQLNYFLENMEASHSFQVAQYYGMIQGTSVGMILFYTDLLAKLWALDYNGIAPKGKIRGFRTPQEITIPKLYWKEYARFSYTRLWFGLQQKAFDVYGDKLLLQPVVTRIYSASADPFTPGEESPPNYQSREFLGWLDRHFEAVAGYEPYYQKLNQLQKWSCIFMVLRGKGYHNLDFLQTVPVAQNLDFETWSKQGAKTNVKIDIHFLDRGQYGCTSECLPTMRSKIFRVMDEEIVLSGGVSLASPKDILPKLSEHDKDADQKQQTLTVPSRKDLPSSGIAKDGQDVSSGGLQPESPASQKQTSTLQKPRTITLTLPKLPAGSSPLSTDDMKLKAPD